MDRVAMMAESRNSVSVYFSAFTRIADLSSSVCLFEGEDQKYFSIRIELIAGNLKWKGMACAGKKNVMELFTLVSNHRTYKDQITFAFIDKDFDEPISEELKNRGVYETPTYSIENFYCTDECISKILNIEFKLNNHPQKPNLHNDVFNRFKLIQREFHEIIKPLNYWIKAHRRKELENPGVHKLNLSRMKVSKYLSIYFDRVDTIIKAEFIPTLFPECSPLSYSEIASSGIYFPIHNAEDLYRGKYQLELIRNFLSLLKEELNSNNSPFYYQNNNSNKLQLSRDNILSELSQYASTPNCLKKFINNMREKSYI